MQPLRKIAVEQAAHGLCFRSRLQTNPCGLDTYFLALCSAVQAKLREIALYAI